MPYDNDNLYGLQRDNPDRPSHKAFTRILHFSGNHIGEVDDGGDEQQYRHHGCEGDSSRRVVKALVTDEPKACGVGFTADRATWAEISLDLSFNSSYKNTTWPLVAFAAVAFFD